MRMSIPPNKDFHHRSTLKNTCSNYPISMAVKQKLGGPVKLKRPFGRRISRKISLKTN